MFRPLRGGIAVFNPNVNELGTVGLIARDATGRNWILSCYHVLCRRDMSAFADGEPIFQPIDGSSNRVANLVAGMGDTTLDCAVARVDVGISVAREILELGTLELPAEPVVGMRLLKSGIETGVTEGQITQVNGDQVLIQRPTGFPNDYDLSRRGDSGAIWVNRDAGSPVALHTGSGGGGSETAFAVRISAVLSRFGLSAL